MKYHVEITCDARILEKRTVPSTMDAVALMSAYLCRGPEVDRERSNLIMVHVLPREIAEQGFAVFAVGAVEAYVTASH